MTVMEQTTPTAGQDAPPRRTQMQVRKRNGDTEAVDVNKIVRAVERWADDLADVDPLRVATKTISGLYDGATTAELDRLSIQHRRRDDRRGTAVLAAGRAAAGRLRRQGGPQPGRRVVQPGRRASVTPRA